MRDHPERPDWNDPNRDTGILTVPPDKAAKIAIEILETLTREQLLETMSMYISDSHGHALVTVMSMEYGQIDVRIDAGAIFCQLLLSLGYDDFAPVLKILNPNECTPTSIFVDKYSEPDDPHHDEPPMCVTS